MSTVYDPSNVNVFCCRLTREELVCRRRKYCEFAREFCATITAKQPKSLDAVRRQAGIFSLLFEDEV
jgi:hypothetical protein